MQTSEYVMIIHQPDTCIHHFRTDSPNSSPHSIHAAFVLTNPDRWLLTMLTPFQTLEVQALISHPCHHVTFEIVQLHAKESAILHPMNLHESP